MKEEQKHCEIMVNKGSHFVDFMRFGPYTYPHNQQSLLPLWVAIMCFISVQVPVRLQDFLINHISRTNWWNSLIFGMSIKIHMN